ncbi:hypothetical protein CHUBBYTHOR_152 [Shigella phage ChubbyThor]|nr:hypothetical protein CHUBBYTHOR_152 [Shigella phage ChubbyThor]
MGLAYWVFIGRRDRFVV